MNKNETKKNLSQLIFFNNRYLMIFCVIISVILWAAVKINYSDETTRVLNDMKINLTSSTVESEFTAFTDGSDLLADVEISGKAYNINSHSLSKDDIIVEASGSFVDSAGYKTLTLTAKFADAAAGVGVEILNITPATVTVYYDKKVTDTFNVVARVDTKKDNFASEGYTVGQPVPSMNTVEVTGPATILSQMKEVYFDAIIDESKLPLKASAELPAEITFGISRQSEAKYLTCTSVDLEKNPATVTIPLNVTKTVPVSVKFVNQPASLQGKAPKYSASPSEVTITYSPKDEGKYEELSVGTIDFRKLDNKVNTVDIPIDREKLAVKLLDTELESFTVTVDMSSMEKTSFAYLNENVLFLNQKEDLTYSLSAENSLSSITVIGPAESLKKLTADNIQIEINVSALNISRTSSQILSVSNISINHPEVDDCWVYGEYNVIVTAAKKE